MIFKRKNQMNCELISKHIVNWLIQRKDASGVKGFVVGVSGGVDSALVSTLCAKTELVTLAIHMPYNTPLSLAVTHLAWLEKNYINVKIENKIPIFDMEQTYKEVVPIHDNNLAYANLQSRIRMTILYLYANTYNLLVVGTGNKVEDEGVGFFTKYGDGGVDISPIGGLLKSQVRDLAEYLGVDSRIIEAAPTDGLWEDGRTDEQQLGATYDELEWAMRAHEELKAGRKYIMAGGESRIYQTFRKWHEKTRHKMEMPPICEIPDDLLK